ncbi:6528_t:CDS:10, partial [Gigaspora margarita]
TLNDTVDTNNTNNTNNTDNNIEQGQGYDSDESSHAPLNNNDMEESFDEDPHNYWIPTAYPRNKNIKFKPLPMDKQILSCMSKQARNTDKKYLEEALLSTRLLILDALLALNVAHRDEALKSFMPSHQSIPETESVFGGELQEIMKKRNRETKFFNDALYQRRRQENLERKPIRPYYNAQGKQIQGWSTDGLSESTTNTLKGILPNLGIYTTITNIYFHLIASKYRNTTGGYTFDRPVGHKGIPYTQAMFCLKHFFSTQKSKNAQANIKEAFHHVPLYPEAQKFFMFECNGKLYHFTCLPFGLSTSPRTFMKILRPGIEMARQINVRLVPYLDDILIMADSYKQAKANKEKVLQLLHKIGFNINTEKSWLEPVQLIDNVQENKHSYLKASIINRKAYSEQTTIVAVDRAAYTSQEKKDSSRITKKMVNKRKRESYKSAQNQDNFEGTDTLEATTRLDNYYKVRFYDHSGIHQSSERHNITKNKSNSRTNMVSVYSAKYYDPGSISARGNEQTSRCSITNSKSAIRVDIVETDIQSRTPERRGFSVGDLTLRRYQLMHLPNCKGGGEHLRSSCIRRQLKKKGFSDRVSELYISSYDPKASESVSACIQKWFNWCASGEHDPVRCSLQTVVDFLDKLYNQNMQYNTIASYRSAISKAHVPRIDLTLIFQLQNSVSVSIQNSKSQKSPAFKAYMAWTSEWHTSQETRKSLFFTTIMPHRPASTDSISSEDLIAKDTWVISAFLAQNSGADLTTIMALENWSNNTVYQKFYQRGVTLLLQKNNVSQKIIDEALSTPQ